MSGLLMLITDLLKCRSLFTFEIYHYESHFFLFKQSHSYVDVCGVCVCAVPFEMVCLLRVGSVMYWNVWDLTAFRVWRTEGLGWGFLWVVGFQEGVKDYIGSWLHTAHGCKTFRPCLDGLLSCDGVTPAGLCQWGRRNVPVHEGVVRNWMCGFYYKTLPCVYCNV